MSNATKFMLYFITGYFVLVALANIMVYLGAKLVVVSFVINTILFGAIGYAFGKFVVNSYKLKENKPAP